MRIGEKKVDLTFGECGDVIFEPSPIWTEPRAYSANFLVDLLEPLRKESNRQCV